MDGCLSRYLWVSALLDTCFFSYSRSRDTHTTPPVHSHNHDHVPHLIPTSCHATTTPTQHTRARFDLKGPRQAPELGSRHIPLHYLRVGQVLTSLRQLLASLDMLPLRSPCSCIHFAAPAIRHVRLSSRVTHLNAPHRRRTPYILDIGRSTLICFNPTFSPGGIFWTKFGASRTSRGALLLPRSLWELEVRETRCGWC